MCKRQIHIAITGGIGSGKSYVCSMLRQRGIEIYDCDAGAKRLMAESPVIREKLTMLVGADAYKDGCLNKPVMASFLLASEENKQAINAIVHPAVIEDFYASGMQWMECAILYEAHLEHTVDCVICVSAPEEVRLRRIMSRDAISKEKAQEWIKTQMPQQTVEQMADVVIVNDGTCSVGEQLDNVLKKLSEQLGIQLSKK